MLGYFILLLPFSICYGYTMQMIMRRNKNQLLKVITSLIAALGIYFLCYSYECSDTSSHLAIVITDVLKRWITPLLIPLALAVMNGLQRKKMFDMTVCLFFIPAVLLGVASTMTHLFGLGAEIHQLVCIHSFNAVISIELIYLFVSNFIKIGGRDLDWNRIWTFFTKNTASRPLMVIGISINVFILLMAERLIFGPESFSHYYYIGIARLLFTSFILLLFCNTLGQANSPWITFKSLFEPVIISGQSEEEEADMLEVEAQGEADIITSLPSEITTLSAAESSMALARIDQLAEDLRQYVEREKAYLQSDITIEKVAAHLGTNRLYISRLVNVEQGMSFRDYINLLRIDHAKAYMKEHPETTQEHIAFVCGFSSASYFNRKFKQITGLSPQDWKAK